MKHTPADDLAWCLLAVQRCSDGTLGWSVGCSLPGTSLHVEKRYTVPTAEDWELAEWVNGFHGESKTWRSLLECVMSDWTSSQPELF